MSSRQFLSESFTTFARTGRLIQRMTRYLPRSLGRGIFAHFACLAALSRSLIPI
ncbi:hypothetical protein BGW80DRAFT_1305910 [Lactifluus volemus]|nr:hypothetical protein BGW80DRAFT_1305910 [Lactifluus volemus]